MINIYSSIVEYPSETRVEGAFVGVEATIRVTWPALKQPWNVGTHLGNTYLPSRYLGRSLLYLSG